MTLLQNKLITIRAHKTGTYWLESKQGYYHTITSLVDYTTDDCYWLLEQLGSDYNVLRVLKCAT